MASTRRKYQHHPVARKREIVEASLRAGASVALVAREYGVNANQVWAWRKLYSEGHLCEPASLTSMTAPANASPALLAVDVIGAQDVPSVSPSSGRLEIVIGSARLSVTGTIDTVMLKAAIAALRT
jgi:transposase